MVFSHRFEAGAYLEADEEDEDHEGSEEHSIEELLEQELTEGTSECLLAYSFMPLAAFETYS